MIFIAVSEARKLTSPPNVTLEKIRAFLLSLPDVTEGMSWDAVSFKVNKKAIVFWNPKYDCPVFKVTMDERDFLLEVDGETFFTTDHHRNYPCILGRPEKLDFDWVKANLMRTWRKQVSKATLKIFDSKN
ncbi:MAG: hypothetical protein FD163_556 [Hyphomonadaceae bacterium]|nr:MAG: hypothetical protein FD128_1746 [Hyphomonadaceae bacterium]KAF0185888.1 MAG: hypothetical protein FD163_556 [Hyphomonadaceae bacterium]